MRKLTKREQTLLKILAVMAAAAVIYFISAGLFFSASKPAEPAAAGKKPIDVLNEMNAEYTGLKREITDYNNILNNQDDNFNTQLQALAESLNIAKNIEYTKRTQTNLQNKYIKINTDIKINGADIQSLLQFISRIEDNDRLIFISYVNIRKGIKEKELYDALIKINTFQKSN